MEKLHYCVHNIPLLVPILSQMNPLYTFPPYFPKIRSNVIFPPTSSSSEWSLPIRFPDQTIQRIYHLSHAYYMPTPSCPWFGHPNDSVTLYFFTAKHVKLCELHYSHIICYPPPCMNIWKWLGAPKRFGKPDLADLGQVTAISVCYNASLCRRPRLERCAFHGGYTPFKKWVDRVPTPTGHKKVTTAHRQRGVFCISDCHIEWTHCLLNEMRKRDSTRCLTRVSWMRWLIAVACHMVVSNTTVTHVR
jgi:hypothetical protein